MRHNVKIYLTLGAILFFFFTSPPLYAANSKIKAVVLPGDSSPEGGTFTELGPASINNPGAIAFWGRTANSEGIYLVSGGTLTRQIKTGDIITGEMNLPGLVAKQDIISGSNVLVRYEYPDRFSLAGRFAVCNKAVKDLIPIQRPLLNDAGNITLKVSDTSSGGNGIVRFSGGTLTRLDCPALTRLIGTLFSKEHFARIHDTIATGINNTGMILLDLFTTETISIGSANFRTFLITGGTPTHLLLEGTLAPGGATILDYRTLGLNDSGDILVRFNEAIRFPPPPRGLFLISGGSRIPVAITGQPAIEGKTFSQVQSSAAMNNRSEVVFIAHLSDSRSAVFHRAPDGTLTPLVRQFDLIPGGGRFSEFQEVAINDNGDVVFNSSAIGGSGGVFLVSAAGGLSNVVRVGEPSPRGGANFTGFSNPKVNNKGEIVFLGFLSNGSRGIFLASSGLETEFVDPVPDLLAGSTVTPDETELAKNGRLVTGIAADGAARVVVRVKTGQAGTVEFSMSDREGESPTFLPADSFNGSLSQVFQSTGSSTVSVSTENVEGVGPMAFAAYHAPNDYARNPSSSEAGERERKAFIRIRLRTSAGETIETTEPLRIVRPPVILVHGLWDSREGWNEFRPLITDPRFFIQRVNYGTTNAAAFALNAPIVRRQITPRIDAYKEAEGVAAVQADVVAHSMGGLMTRMLPLSEDGYFRDDNYNLGDVHKVINFGTPNFGTRFAQFLLRSPCVSQAFKDNERPSDQGAVEDMAPNSQALNQINNMVSPLQLHQIVGLAGFFDKQDTETSLGFFYLRIKCRIDFAGLPRVGFFDTVLLTPDHDIVVPAFSQQARATTNFTPIPDVIHSRVIPLFIGIGEMESENISKRVIELLHTPLRQPDFDTFQIP